MWPLVPSARDWAWLPVWLIAASIMTKPGIKGEGLEGDIGNYIYIFFF